MVCLAIPFLSVVASAATLDEVRAWTQTKNLEELLLAVADADSDVSQAARNALGNLDEPLGDLLWSGIRGSPTAMAALAEQKDLRATAPLVRALGNARPLFRGYVVQILGDLGDPRAVPALIDFIQSESGAPGPMFDPASPYWALNKLKDPRALDVYLDGLQSRNTQVREAAAWGIQGVMAPRAAEAVLAALSDTNSSVREAGAYALMKLPQSAATGPLIGLLSDPVAPVRVAAAYALGQSGDEAARGPLRSALGDDSDLVRTAAAWAVGRLRDAESLDALFGLLGDSSAAVRAAAASALGDLGQPIGAQFRAAMAGETAAQAALSSAGDPRVVDPLIRLAKSSDTEIRLSAYRVLASFPDPRARAAIVDSAAQWNPFDRVGAGWALLTSPGTSVGTKITQTFEVAARPSSLTYLGLAVALPSVLLLMVRRRPRPARNNR